MTTCMKIVLLGVGDASVANFITSIASFGSCAVAEHSTVDLAVLPSGEGDTLKRIALIRQSQAGNCFDEFKELSFQVNRANWSCELKLLPFPGAAFERHFVKVVHAIGKSSTAVQDSTDSESADLALAGAIDFIAAADAIVLLLPKLPQLVGMDAPESPLRLVPTLLAAIRAQFELSGRAIALLPVLTHPEEQEPQDSQNQRHENPTTATQRLRALVSSSLNRAVDVFECGVGAPDQASSSNSLRANRPTPVSEVIARAVELPGALQLTNMSARRSDTTWIWRWARYSKLSNLIVSGRLSPPNESMARKSRMRGRVHNIMLIATLCALPVLGVVVWRTAETWIALSNIKAEFATDPNRTRLLELEVEHGSVGGIWRVILGTQWTECDALIHKCKIGHDSKLEDGLSSISTPSSIRKQLEDAKSLESQLTERTKLLLTDDAKIRNTDRLNENSKKLGSLNAHLPIEEQLDALLPSQGSPMTPRQMASQVDSLSPTSFPLLKGRFEQVESQIKMKNEARLKELRECLGTEKLRDDPNGTAQDPLAAAALGLIEIEAASDFCSGCPRIQSEIGELRAANKEWKARIELYAPYDLEEHGLGAEPSIKALAAFLLKFGADNYPYRREKIDQLRTKLFSLEQAKVTSLSSDLANDRLALNDKLGWETYCRRAKERNEICVVALGELDSKHCKEEVSNLMTPEDDIKNREFYGPFNDGLKGVDLLNTLGEKLLAAQQVLRKFSCSEYQAREQELNELKANVLIWQKTVEIDLKTELSRLADEHGDCTEIRLKHASQRLELIDEAEASWGKQSELLSELTKLRDEHREIQTQITHYGPFDDAYRDVAAKKNIKALAAFLLKFGADKYPKRKADIAKLLEDLNDLEQAKVTDLERALNSASLCSDPKLHWRGQVAREEAGNVMCDELLTELSPESTFREQVKRLKTNEAANLNVYGPLQDELFKVNQLSKHHDQIPAARRLLGEFEASKYPKHKKELDDLAKNLEEWQASIARELKVASDASDKPDDTPVVLNWKQKVSLRRARELKIEAVLELLSEEERKTYSTKLEESKEGTEQLSLEGPIRDQLTQALSTEQTLESLTVELSDFLVRNEGQIPGINNSIFTEARDKLKEARTQLWAKLYADLQRETLKLDDTLPQSDLESRAEQRVGIVQQLINAASWDEKNRKCLMTHLETETKKLMLAKQYGPIDVQIKGFKSLPSDLSADRLADKMKQLDDFLARTKSAEFPKRSTALDELHKKLNDYFEELKKQTNTALEKKGVDDSKSYSNLILRLEAQASALNDAVIRIPPTFETKCKEWSDNLAEVEKNLERAKVVKNVEDELNKVLKQDAAKEPQTPEEMKPRLRALNQAMGLATNVTYPELILLIKEVAIQQCQLEYQIIDLAIQESESHKDRDGEPWEKRFELAKKRRDRLAEARNLLEAGESKVPSSLDLPLTRANEAVKDFEQMRDAESDITAALQSSNMKEVAEAIDVYQGTSYTQVSATPKLKLHLMVLAQDEYKKLVGELANAPQNTVVDSSSLEAVNKTNKQREKLLNAALANFPDVSSPVDDFKEKIKKLMESDQQWCKTQKARHLFIVAAEACTLNESDIINSIKNIEEALKQYAENELESDPKLKALADELKEKQKVWKVMSDWEVLKSNLEALKKKVARGPTPEYFQQLVELEQTFDKLKDDSSKTLPESDPHLSPDYFKGYQDKIEEIRKELKANTPATRESK